MPLTDFHITKICLCIQQAAIFFLQIKRWIRWLGQFLLHRFLACGFPLPAAADCGCSARLYLQLNASFLSTSPSLCLPSPSTLHSTPLHSTPLPALLICFLSNFHLFHPSLTSLYLMFILVHPSLLCPLKQFQRGYKRERQSCIYPVFQLETFLALTTVGRL